MNTHSFDTVLRKASLLLVMLLLMPLGASAAQGGRILVYGDSNSWGWRPVIEAAPTTRLRDEERWPGVMQRWLGNHYTVVVDGLSGRTVDIGYADKFGTVEGAEFNGETNLRAAIARELPLDLVVIMLGTNDLRDSLDRSPQQIASGISRLVAIVRTDYAGVLTTYAQPKVLVVVPAPLGDVSRTPFGALLLAAGPKSRQLSGAIRSEGLRNDYAVVDAADFVGEAGGIDGIHLTAQEHRALGFGVATTVRRLLDAH